ncbi:hypothetical protein EV672_1207 [Aquabacterium commune]|uniref:Uncharacterized protein n=1 Tax=Aquabacterium commune TaxID=70586 RepID=A0A4R6QZR5_9BURK|nr:DUF6488 family protein [Aquabacterium commune]TDP78675.1 hypothetical protein EV672_1207 [Aquabacterium commune]
MKKLISIATMLAGLGLSSQALASGAADCHFHGLAQANQETVSQCAVKRQKGLIAAGKIDKSWDGAKPTAIEQVDGKRAKEWKVTFNDPAAADKAKENLYMFFTLQGNFIAANFSGK